MNKVYGILACLAFAACASQPTTQQQASNDHAYRGVAASEQLGHPIYPPAGGDITLNESGNNNLAILLHNLPSDYSQLAVYDHSSRRLIKAYTIQGSSYTLSKAMLEGLSDDCQVDFDMAGPYTQNYRFIVYIPWCVQHGQTVSTGIKSYQLSRAKNCKLLVNGNYSGKNVDVSFCDGGTNEKDIISYEYSNKKNCKRMVNGDYSGHNVDESFCE